LEGLAYRLLPVRNSFNPNEDFGRVNTDIMFDNVMNKFKWGGVDVGPVYMDENNLRMTMNLRNNFDRLATALLMEGKKDSAVKVLDKAFEVMPEFNVPYNYFVVPLAEAYYRADVTDKPDLILNRYADILEQELNWQLNQKSSIQKLLESQIQRNMAIFRRIADIARRNKRVDMSKNLEERFEGIESRLGMMGGLSNNP
jgi:uncharacterized secreted protein with C-terminal beta-propeller domain